MAGFASFARKPPCPDFGSTGIPLAAGGVPPTALSHETCDRATETVAVPLDQDTTPKTIEFGRIRASSG